MRMRNNRTYLVVFLCIALLFSTFLGGCDLNRNANLPEQDVVILYTNDVHCAVNTNIGYAGIAALEKEYRDSGADVLLVDCGDAIQGEPIGTISQGATIVEIMNQVGYDVAAIGNHEFGYGYEQFLALVEQADYPYVSCNFRYIDSEETVFNQYALLEAGGVQIAFVGVITPETLIASSPAHFQDQAGNYLFTFDQKTDGTQLYDTVQSAVNDAKEQGADYVVVLAHLGMYSENPAYNSASLIANTTGIDVVLDGHSHSVIESERIENADGEPVLLSQTGTKFASVGKLFIQKDGSISTELIYEYEEKDPTIEAFIEEQQNAFQQEIQKVVAKTSVDLTILDVKTGNRLVRNGETNLADLCADAFRFGTGADVSIINAGDVRDNLAQGEITYEDLLKVHPFSNLICVAEVTGQTLLDALEFGARMYPKENGDFLHVSGISYEIDSSIPSSTVTNEDGAFIGMNGPYRVQNVLVNGVPLEVDQTYTLASIDYFLKDAGGGFTMLQGNPLLQDTGVLDYQNLAYYLTEFLNGEVGSDYANPYGEGRIIIK